MRSAIVFFILASGHASSQELEPMVTSLSVSIDYGCAVASDDNGSYLSCFGIGQLPTQLSKFANPTEVQAGQQMTCIIADAGVICEKLVDGNVSIIVPKERAPRALASDGEQSFCADEQLGVHCWTSLTTPDEIYFNTHAEKIEVGGPNEEPCFRNANVWQCYGGDLDKNMSEATYLVGYHSGACTLNLEQGVRCSKDLKTSFFEGPRHIFRFGGSVVVTDAEGVWFAGRDKINFKKQFPNFKYENASIITTTPQKSFSDFNSYLCVTDGRGVECAGRLHYYNGAAKPPRFEQSVSDLTIGTGPVRCAKTTGKRVCWGNLEAIPSTVDINKYSALALGQVSCGYAANKVECWEYFSSAAPTPFQLEDVSLLTSNLPANSSLNTCAAHKAGVTCWSNYKIDRRYSSPLTKPPTSLATGDSAACAVEEGKVRCWDIYSEREFSNSLSEFGLATKVVMSKNKACGLFSDSMVCWNAETSRIVEKKNIDTPQDIAMGLKHTCIISGDKVQCWGDNSRDQTDVPIMQNPRSIVSDPYSTCAVADEGVVCWGNDRVVLR